MLLPLLAVAPIETQVASQMAAVLIHFLWQGFAIAALLIAGVQAARIRSSSARYACSVCALASMAAMPILTGWILRESRIPPVPGNVPVDEAPGTLALPTDSRRFTESVVADDSLDGSPTRGQSTQLQSDTPVPLQGRSDEIPGTIVVLWSLGVFLFSLRLILAGLGLGRLRRRTQSAPVWLERIALDLAGRLRMSPPQLAVSPRLTDALALGFFRPMILIPAAWLTRMPPDMLEAVLAHELAHIRRRDLWVNLCQRVIETLFFYHPAIWWLSHRLRCERELCCDEQVLNLTRNPARYAETLARVGHLAAGRSPAALTVSVSGVPSLLLARVRNVLGLPVRESLPRRISLAAVPLALASWMLATGPLQATPQLAEIVDPGAAAASLKTELPLPQPSTLDAAVQLTGRVVDAQNQPVPDADVLLFQKTSHEQPPRLIQSTRTDSKGLFHFKGAAEQFQDAAVWSIVPWQQTWRGPALGWCMRPVTNRTPVAESGEAAENDPDRFVLRLNPVPGLVSIETPERMPARDAKVMVTALLPARSQTAQKHLRLELSGNDALDRFDQNESIPVPQEFRPLLTGVTDDRGRVWFMGIQADRLASIDVETEDYGSQRVRRHWAVRQQDSYRFRLAPVGQIDGTVVLDERARRAGLTPNSLRLRVRTQQPVNAPTNSDESDPLPPPEGYATAVVDAQGNFSIPRLAVGAVEWESPWPADSSHAFLPPLAIRVASNSRATVQVDIVEKVRVEGSVRQRSPGTTLAVIPVAGAPVLLSQFRTSAFQYPFSQIVTTDASGRFEALVLPQVVEYRLQRPVDGLAAVHAWESPDPRSALGLRHVVPATGERVTLPPLELVATRARAGTLVNLQGQPVSSGWEILGLPGDSRVPCAIAPVHDRGEFRLVFPETVPPTQFVARKRGSRSAGPRPLATNLKLVVLQESPLQLQLPVGESVSRPGPTSATQTAPPPAERTPSELAELRRIRKARHDRQAAATLAGPWSLTLPAGYCYPVTLVLRDDGFLELASSSELTLKGVFAYSQEQLELIEAPATVQDFCWKRQPEGTLRLVFEQHRHGATYVGATLKPVRVSTPPPTTPAPVKKSKAMPVPTPARPAVPTAAALDAARFLTRDDAPALVGNWTLTVSDTFRFSVTITLNPQGDLVLKCPQGGNLMGTYTLLRRKLLLVDHVDGAAIDFTWRIDSTDRLTLVAEQHRYGPNYVGARLERTPSP